MLAAPAHRKERDEWAPGGSEDYHRPHAVIVIGEEDVIATVADGELMRQNIAGSQLKVIPKAGHYAPWEQSEAVGMVFRQFLDYVIDNPLTNH